MDKLKANFYSENICTGFKVVPLGKIDKVLQGYLMQLNNLEGETANKQVASNRGINLVLASLYLLYITTCLPVEAKIGSCFLIAALLIQTYQEINLSADLSP